MNEMNIGGVMFFVGAGISGNCRESEALPSGTQVAARREVLTIRLLVVDWVGAKWGFC